MGFLAGYNPIWTFVDASGNIAVGATLGTYRSVNHSEKKAVYSDPAGVAPYENPVNLQTTGRGTIYFNDDENYYIEVYDINGNLLHTEDNYNAPGGSGGGPVTHISSDENYIINGQFRINKGQKSGTDIGKSTALIIADPAWSYYKNGTGAFDTISFPNFSLGDNIPEATPVNYLKVVCTTEATGETFKYVEFFMPDVRSFEQLQLTSALSSKSSSSSSIEIVITQYFGTGGSPSTSVDTILGGTAIGLTGSWADYNRTGTLPSVGGKTIGTNKDDGIFYRINFPLNTVFTVDLVNISLLAGSDALPFQFKNYNLNRMQTIGSMIPVPNSDGGDNSDEGKVLSVGDNSLSWEVLNDVGKYFRALKTTDPYRKTIEMVDSGVELVKDTNITEISPNNLIKFLNSNNIRKSRYSFLFSETATTLIVENGAGCVVLPATTNATPHITVAATTPEFDALITIEKVPNEDNSVIFTHTQNFIPSQNSDNRAVNGFGSNPNLTSPILPIFGPDFQTPNGDSYFSAAVNNEILEVGTNEKPAKVKTQFFGSFGIDQRLFFTSQNGYSGPSGTGTTNFITYNISTNNPANQPTDGIYCIAFTDSTNRTSIAHVPTPTVKRIDIDMEGSVSVKDAIHKMFITINNSQVSTFTFASIPTNGQYISLPNFKGLKDVIFYDTTQTKPVAPNPTRDHIFISYDPSSATITSIKKLIIDGMDENYAGVPEPSYLNLDLESDFGYYIYL